MYKTKTYLDLERDLEWDLDLEWREPSLERAGECAGERLADFPEPRGLTLLEPDRESCTGQTHRGQNKYTRNRQTDWRERHTG